MNCHLKLCITQLNISLISICVFTNYLQAQDLTPSYHTPELNPPVIDGDTTLQAPASFSAGNYDPLPLTEWTYHKSADGSRPNGTEQQYMWLMNRARSNPTVEGIWLSVLREPKVASVLNYRDINLPLLREEFAAFVLAQPGAFDIRLHNAAIAHSEYLIGIDDQGHDGQFTRVRDAGFTYSNARGSVFSYSRSGIYGHAGFNIDWGGDDGTGMQTGRGHRQAIMLAYPNVGVGIVEDSDSGTSVGPEVTTINYCYAGTWVDEHYNRFIVGTVWDDANGNRLYDPGEGIGGVTVTPDKGDFYAITGDAGGYSIPVDADTTYAITYTGASLPTTVNKTAVVDGICSTTEVASSGL